MEFITVERRGRKLAQADVARKAAEAAARLKASMEERRAKSLAGSEAAAAAAVVAAETQAKAKADAVLEPTTVKKSWADMTDSDDEDECFPCARSEPEAEAPVQKPKAVKKSWADMSSDDEDEDEPPASPVQRKQPEPEVEASPLPLQRKPEAKKRWADIESDDEDDDDWSPASKPPEPEAEARAATPRTSVASTQPESEVTPRGSVTSLPPSDRAEEEVDEWTTVKRKDKKAKPAQTLAPPRAPWAKPQQVREEPPWRKKRA